MKHTDKSDRVARSVMLYLNYLRGLGNVEEVYFNGEADDEVTLGELVDLWVRLTKSRKAFTRRDTAS